MSNKADSLRVGGVDGANFVSVVTPGVMSSFQIFTGRGIARFDLKPEELAEVRTLIDRHLLAHASELPHANGSHEIAMLPEAVPESGFPVDGTLPEWLVPGSIIAPNTGGSMRLAIYAGEAYAEIVSRPLRYFGTVGEPLMPLLTDRDGNPVTIMILSLAQSEAGDD